MAKHGVLLDQSWHPPVLNHGGLQEGVVHALPIVQGVGGLAVVQGLVKDSANTFPRQEPLNHQHGVSVWKRLFVSKPQTFLFNSSPVVESSPWSARATPSAWPTKSSATPSTTLVSPEVLPSRISPSLTSPTTVSSRASVSVLDPTSLQLPPFKRSGPLGVEGESVSLEELKSRSKPLVQSFAWDSLSLGTKKVYTLNWKLFSNFGYLHGVNVNNYDWDFSFVNIFYFVSETQVPSILYFRLAAP